MYAPKHTLGYSEVGVQGELQTRPSSWAESPSVEPGPRSNPFLVNL